MKILVKTNNLKPNSTNHSKSQHSLRVNFNYIIFNSTNLSQYQQTFFFPQLQQLYFEFNDFLSTSTPLRCEFQHWNENQQRNYLKKMFFWAPRSTLAATLNVHPPKGCQDQQLQN